MKKISLITVFNNQAVLDEMIVSVRKQVDVDVNYVMIDNRTGLFKSAASALNYGISKAIFFTKILYSCQKMHCRKYLILQKLIAM